MNNWGLLFGKKSPLSWIITRKFSVSATNNKCYSCKLLVLGGGSGGCTVAAKFARREETKKSVIILEPSEDHYYQPLWTLVGAGIRRLSDTRRLMKSVLPEGPLWLRDHAAKIDPSACQVTTGNGDVINYEYIVIAVGLKYDYHKVPGLLDALDDRGSHVSTIYDARYAEKTFSDMQSFRGGDAVFTYPDTQIKCPGAPQKIAYLADSYFREKGVRNNATITYNTCLPVIFGVKKYADALLKVVERKKIVVNYRTVLKEVRPKEKVAVFKREGCEDLEMNYQMLHATPPMSPPEVVSSSTVLADTAGFLNVDKYTLQHNNFDNIYGIGDCTNTPNSKTAAAIAKQCYVLEENLLLSMKNKPATAKYDGYGACPLVTSYNTCILAEFTYGGVIHETFPFDQLFQSAESRIAYYMKRDLFPFIYWNFMLKGNYHGPEFIRKIVNSRGK